MKLGYITLLFIIIGLCFWYVFSQLYPEFYDKYYFSWCKGKDFLYAITIGFLLLKPVKNKCLAKSYLVLSVFLLFRFVWWAFSIQDYKWATSIHVMGSLFIVFTITLLIIIWINCKNLWNYKSR